MGNTVKSRGRFTALGFALLGCMGSALALASVQPAWAQTAANPTAEQPVTLNFEHGDIQAVLKALFNDIGANYSIDSNVNGTVSISMSNVGFLAALRSVLRANNPPLTFDYTDGVYHIRVRAQQPAAPTTVAPPEASDQSNSDNSEADQSTGDMRYYKIPVDHYDVREMAGFIATMNRRISELVPVQGAGGGGGGGGGVSVSNGGGGISNSGGISTGAGATSIGGGYH